MRTTIIAATMLAALALPAAAERVDRRIDEAAGRIIAERIGELRPGFEIGVVPAMVRPIERSDGEPRWIGSRF